MPEGRRVPPESWCCRPPRSPPEAGSGDADVLGCSNERPDQTRSSRRAVAIVCGGVASQLEPKARASPSMRRPHLWIGHPPSRARWVAIGPSLASPEAGPGNVTHIAGVWGVGRWMQMIRSRPHCHPLPAAIEVPRSPSVAARPLVRTVRGSPTVASDWPPQACKEGRAMPQIFRPYADLLMRMVLVAILVGPLAGVGIAYAVMRSPYVTGQNLTIEQPVPFSHEHHVGKLGLDCRYCHNAVERSPVASVPPTHTCMTCHSQLFTQAAMLAPVRKSMAEHMPLHWNRVHRLPDYVYFDHSVHIANGVGCTTCHGQIANMPLMRQSAPLTMAWCLDCHRDPTHYLRPRSEIFSPTWGPPKDQLEQGRKLLIQYQIHVEHLTDCSVCHR